MTAAKPSLVHPSYKTKYKVQNWPEYEAGLRARGDVTIWFSEEAIRAWTPRPNGRRGGQRRYSDLAIETALTLRLVFHLPLALTLRLVFHLPLRQAEGFVGSLLRLMSLDLVAPDHTTLSRRATQLDIALRSHAAAGPIHLIVDSTGLEVVGQGQWAAAKHGTKGVRGWRKLHVGVDASGVIVAELLTESTTDDAAVVPALVEQIEVGIDRFTGDGAYDKRAIYETFIPRGATVVVPPSRRAIESGGDTPADQARDSAVRRIREVGRREWRQESGHHQQARAENTFFRYKRVLGGRLRARDPDGRRAEARLACNILNRMLELGAARSCAIEA